MTFIEWQLKSNGSQKDIKLLLARTPKSQLFYIFLRRGGLSDGDIPCDGQKGSQVVLVALFSLDLQQLIQKECPS